MLDWNKADRLANAGRGRPAGGKLDVSCGTKLHLLTAQGSTVAAAA